MPTTGDLYNAIDKNNLEAVKVLLDDDLADTSAYNYGTPLFQAATLGHFEIVRYLLERGKYTIDEGNDETWYSPLMAACENGFTEIAGLLVEHGADVDRQYEKEEECEENFGTCSEQGYPLTLAVGNDHAEIVKLLLEHDVDFECSRTSYDGVGNFSNTPLLLALQRNNLEMAELLLTHGADVDGECILSNEEHTPLSYAVAKKKAEWAAFLLRHGADITKVVEGGLTVAEYAEDLGRAEMLRI